MTELKPIEFENRFDPHKKDAALRNIRSACGRHLETVTRMQKPHGRKMAVVGSGPSARNYLSEIRDLERSGVCIMAVNESYDWLVRNDIHPWGVVYTEIDPWAEPLFCEEVPGTTFFIASQCDPSVFDWIGDRRIVLWHALQGIGEDKVVAECQGGGDLVAGGVTPAMRSIHLGVVLGFRDFELFGMDSSYETNSHAMRDDQRADFAADATMEVHCLGKVFKTKAYLAQQADSFATMCRLFGNLLSFKVHGEGLLPHIHQSICPQYYQEKV